MRILQVTQAYYPFQDRGGRAIKVRSIARALVALVHGYLSGAGRMVATSEQERAELLAEGFAPDRVLLRYNGIDREEFRQLPPPGAFRKKVGIRDDERCIVFLGRLIQRKGADLLIEALAHINGGTVAPGFSPAP